VGKEPCQDSFLGNAPVANDPNRIDGLRLLGQGCAGGETSASKSIVRARRLVGPQNAREMECA
jgi:hypothetical protein